MGIMEKVTLGNITKLVVVSWIAKKVFVDDDVYDSIKAKIKHEIEKFCEIEKGGKKK